MDAILERAVVPEHSVGFMRAVSGGEPFLEGAYLFLAAQDWLVAVGYSLDGTPDSAGFESALRGALLRTKARRCWAISPSLPARLRCWCRERDHYYTLPVDTPLPARLVRRAERASRALHVERGNTFTAGHRRLWAEFLGRVPLPPNVRELYARTEQALAEAPALTLLNAWDGDGRLVACLLVDSAPRRFLSYLIGAHSRLGVIPHASDRLFLEMVRMAREAGKEFIHLGLGVHDGIRRFKTKWGAAATLPYEMAAWEEREGVRGEVDRFMRVLISSPAASMSKRQYLASLPAQRRFAMIWEVERDGARSWIGGTAHFFCYSFEYAFRDLFEKVDTVLFEGPLDRGSLDRVSTVGRSPGPHTPRLLDVLDEDELQRLERVVNGPTGFWARLLGLETSNPTPVRSLLAETRPWMAFFSIWTSYLARRGWTHSVDLEAWEVARDMGKTVQGMETIEEQIETLERIPVRRIVDFFRQCGHWDRYIRRNVRAYLKGDLDGMMGTSTEFPSRTELVINRRDGRFLERMLPYLEKGRCAVMVGSAHLVNLRGMLADAGFSVRKCR